MRRCTSFWASTSCCWAAALGVALCLPARASAADKPNIVLVMADDLEVGVMNALLTENLAPNLAELVDSGLSFSRAFVTTPVCGPSRATLLTGQYTHNHRVFRNEFPSGVAALNEGSTLATWLRTAGYRTGHIGKYVNGYGTSDINHDGRYNSDDFLHIPPGWDEWFTLVEPFSGTMYYYAVNDNAMIRAYADGEADYLTDVLARRAEAFIDRSESLDDARPFFLAIMPTAPHQEVWFGLDIDEYADAWKWTVRPAPRHLGAVTTPLPMPPSFNEANVSDKPAWIRQRPLLTSQDINALRTQYRDRIASMRAVDDLVGAIVARLQANGELANTVLIFTSDNGFFSGEHRLPQKLSPHEESIRVPLVVRGPGVVSGSASQIVLNTDLAPTIAELAGATPGIAVDGTSFAPILSQPGRANWRKRFLIERWNGLTGIFETPTYFAVRTGAAPGAPNQLFVQYWDWPGSREFYDLAIDPYQLASLHADASQTRAVQRFIHSVWIPSLGSCAGAACAAAEFHPVN